MQQLAPAVERRPGVPGTIRERVDAVAPRSRRDDEEDDKPRERQAEQPGVARSRRTLGRAAELRRAGLHLFHEPRVERATRMSRSMCASAPAPLSVRELQHLQQVARRRPRERVRLPVAVVVLEPLGRLRRAPASANACASLRPGRVLPEHEHADPRDRPSFGYMYSTFRLLALHRHPVVGPRIRDPELTRARTRSEVGLGRPEHAHEMLLRLEQVLRALQLRVGLVVRHLEAEVVAGPHERVQIVEPRDLPLVALVEQEPPRTRLRLHLVGAVEDRVEAPVGRMPHSFPPNCPALTMPGFRCLKFEISDGVQGWKKPLCAKSCT